MRWALSALLVVVIAVAGLGGMDAPAGAAVVWPTDAVASIQSGDVVLAADVMTPGGTGLHPLVVMPAPWDGSQFVYQNLATALVRAGFVVVAYAQRGFSDSGGQVDFAGPESVADASNVISWALANTPADPGEVGMMGFSCGAGVSLLAAEQDSRVKAVVALSPWTDLAGALAPGGAVNAAGLHELLSNGSSSQTLDGDLTTLAGEYATDPSAAAALIDSMSPVRSADTDVAALNARGTPVMLGGGFEDTLFPASQLTSFYAALTGPKRLDLVPGDHGQPEYNGLVLGEQAGMAGDATAWLAHYLAGEPNGIDSQPGISEQDQNRQTSDETGLPTVSAANTWNLGTPGQAGDLTSAERAPELPAPEDWTAPFTTATDSGADEPHEQMDIADPYHYPHFDPSTVAPGTGTVWTTEALPSEGRIDGSPELHLAVAAAQDQTDPTTDSPVAATLFAYLYDVAPDGTGTLVTAGPETITELTSTGDTNITAELEPIDWELPAGHSLALVVDTQDPRWNSPVLAGTAIRVDSDALNRAVLTLPGSVTAADPQSIALDPPAATSYNGADVPLTATASSGLPVQFTASGACTVTSDSNGTQLQPLHAGTCTVTATQPGDDDYLPAPPATQTITIAKADQTISFGRPADRTFGEAAFTETATASSGLPVSLTAAGACTVTGAKVVLTEAGTCSLVARQAGDVDWNAAVPVTQMFTVTKATPRVTVTTSPTKPVTGKITIAVTVTGAPGQTPQGAVQITRADQHCTISTLTRAGTGSCSLTATAGTKTITANYSGNLNYLASNGTAPGTVAKAKPGLSTHATLAKSKVPHHVVLTETVTVHAAAGIAALGTITVSTGDIRCTAKLSHDLARCNLRLGIGTYHLTVSYPGDSNYTPVDATPTVKT